MKRARGFGTIGDLRLRGGEDPGSTVQIPGSLLDAGFMVKEKANLGAMPCFMKRLERPYDTEEVQSLAALLHNWLLRSSK